MQLKFSPRNITHWMDKLGLDKNSLPTHTFMGSHAHLYTQTTQDSCRGCLLLQHIHHNVGGVELLWEDLIPTCLEFPPHLFATMLKERLLCFPCMPAVWTAMLLWACVYIWLPAYVQGALVISQRDALTKVFKLQSLIRFICQID